MKAQAGMTLPIRRTSPPTSERRSRRAPSIEDVYMGRVFESIRKADPTGILLRELNSAIRDSTIGQTEGHSRARRATELAFCGTVKRSRGSGQRSKVQREDIPGLLRLIAADLVGTSSSELAASLIATNKTSLENMQDEYHVDLGLFNRIASTFEQDRCVTSTITRLYSQLEDDDIGVASIDSITFVSCELVFRILHRLQDLGVIGIVPDDIFEPFVMDDEIKAEHIPDTLQDCFLMSCLCSTPRTSNGGDWEMKLVQDEVDLSLQRLDLHLEGGHSILRVKGLTKHGGVATSSSASCSSSSTIQSSGRTRQGGTPHPRRSRPASIAMTDTSAPFAPSPDLSTGQETTPSSCCTDEDSTPPRGEDKPSHRGDEGVSTWHVSPTVAQPATYPAIVAEKDVPHAEPRTATFRDHLADSTPSEKHVAAISTASSTPASITDSSNIVPVCDSPPELDDTPVQVSRCEPHPRVANDARGFNGTKQHASIIVSSSKESNTVSIAKPILTSGHASLDNGISNHEEEFANVPNEFNARTTTNPTHLNASSVTHRCQRRADQGVRRDSLIRQRLQKIQAYSHDQEYRSRALRICALGTGIALGAIATIIALDVALVLDDLVHDPALLNTSPI